MPIPSLNPSLKLRHQSTHTKETARSESSRRPLRDDSVAAAAAAAAAASRPTRPNNPLNDLKKGSHLPQRGLPKPVTRITGPLNTQDSKPSATSISTTSIPSPRPSHVAEGPRAVNVNNLREGHLRPRSLYPTRTTRYESDPHGDPAQAAQPLHAANMSTVLPVDGLDRSRSLRRPGLSARQVPSASSRAHSRTQSTSTITSARNASGDGNVLGQRPKSLLLAPGSSHVPSSTGQPPLDGTAGSTMSSTRTGAPKRSTSTRVRSEAPPGRMITGASSSSYEVTQSQGRREEKEDAKKLSRPTFTTLQQHFTPRKSGKTATSVFLKPAPNSGSQALPPDIISLQSELLQLHLLHQASGAVTQRWELRAREHLRRKFEEVASLWHGLRENERHGLEQKNILALRDWNGDNPLSGLVDPIRTLCGPLHELPSLIEDGGRFHRHESEFANWAAWVEEIWSARGGFAGHVGSESLEGLGDSWKLENAALTRKLTAFARNWDGSAAPTPGSTVACIVSTCKALVGGLLQELQLMHEIEVSVVAAEEKWIEDRLTTIAHDVGFRLENMEGQEAWRT